MASIEAPPAEFLTAAEMARLLRVDVKTVRRHADELGAVPIGRTLRFPFPTRGPSTGARGPRPDAHRIR